MAELLHCLDGTSPSASDSLIKHFDGCPGGSCSNNDDSTPCLACEECNARDNRIVELQTRNADLERKNADLERKIQAWQHEELELRKQVTELYAGQTADFCSWREQIYRMSANENEITRLKRGLWIEEQKNKVLKQSLENDKDVLDELKTLKQARDHYSKEASELHAECGKLQEEIGKQSREIEDLKCQRDDWKDVAMSRTNLTPPQPSDGDTPAPAVVVGDQSGQIVHKRRRIPTTLATAPSSAVT